MSSWTKIFLSPLHSELVKNIRFHCIKNICRDNKNILCQGEEVFTQRRCTECVCKNGEIRCEAVDTGRCGAGAGAGCAGPEYLCGDAGEETGDGRYCVETSHRLAKTLYCTEVGWKVESLQWVSRLTHSQ